MANVEIKIPVRLYIDLRVYMGSSVEGHSYGTPKLCQIFSQMFEAEGGDAFSGYSGVDK